MANIVSGVLELIGKTPLVRLEKYERYINAQAKIFAKVEFFNPAGSVKDRVAFAMIKKAEQQGKINKDTVIIEPTSGNTGIGLACVCAYLGYKLILTMPETMSVERRKLLSVYGAEIVLTDGKKGMSGAIEKANELAEKNKNSFIPGQFENPANPEAHYLSTAPEIWEALDGSIDAFVAGAGTGGTVSGIGRFLKEKNKDIKIIAIEPDSSAVISGEKPGAHKLQGIGAGFIPENLDVGLLDEVIKVSAEDAYEATRLLVKTEGLLCGISSGAALFAAGEAAKKEEYKNKNIVVLLPDSGSRYLSVEDLF